MKIGSLVNTEVSFEKLQKQWKFVQFPKKGDILTISNIEVHPKCKDTNLLHFEELPNHPSGICDQSKGVWNFKEIQPPMKIDIEELISNFELV